MAEGPTKRSGGMASALRRVFAWTPYARALRAAQARADRAEARLREAMEAMPEGVVMLDADGRYILWNSKYAEIYHRSADLFAVGAYFADTLRQGVERGDYPEAIGREEEWLRHRLALLGDPGQRHEQQIADGHWLLIEERRMADGGSVGLRIDITDMKRQAKALQDAKAKAEAANRAKSEFLANMGHEIRTPLNGVLGLADVLSRTDLSAAQRDLVETIIGSATDLNHLLSDLLDFSRLEAGRLELSDDEFGLRDLVRRSTALFEAAAAAKGVQIIAAVDPEAPDRLIGDAARLKQILTNLLSNAVKFTERGRVSLTAHLDGESLRFVVRDTGRGFEPAVAERLFGRFEQEDGSITRAHGGVGLGLSICRQLAELMQGSISATGRPGEGAVFTLVIPLRRAETEAPIPIQADAEAMDRPLRVLLAEDNPVNRQVVELMLQAVGAEVDSVENGALAVEALRAAAYDVILMDLQMPVMDGLAATRAIRAWQTPRRERTPIVVLSANVMPEHLAASRAAGADNHIGKPIRAEALIAAVIEAVHGVEGEQAAVA